ncbi:MAG: diadenylate cyclase [Flavobacteriaceae bacterium]|nr:diadenylate cyclase [Flavobacteriaceae bacterium]
MEAIIKDITFLDLIDVILVAALLYYIYKLVKGTVAINILIGIAILYFIWKITELLEMKLVSTILSTFGKVGIFALIVVFQQEIRKFLLLIGSTRFFTDNKIVKRFNLFQSEATTATNVEAVITACNKMAATKTGVLLVFQRKNSLEFVKNTGDAMQIELKQAILESIFYKNSQLHDGAVIVEGNFITATRTILPVSNQQNIPSRFGLRHKAAIGITERTDALAIVVSEETGQISYIKNGEFILFDDTEELIELIKKDLG